MMNKELIQLVDIILYRLERSTQNAGENFFAFSAGKDSRSSGEILSHLVDVSSYGLSLMNATPPTNSKNSTLEKIDGNFIAMKSFLYKNDINEQTAKKLINGPLSDTLTHIGQLALLRRLEGNPMEWENYTNAET